MRTFALLALLAATPASALTYQRHVLSNGLVVILHRDDSSPLVAVNVWYKVGSKNEQPGHTGFAHFFEHYMFEGSRNVSSGEIDEVTLRRLGGNNNAFTANDETNYYEVVPPNGLDEVLRLESDRMGFLQDNLNEKYLEKVRGTVINEKLQREGVPYGQAVDERVLAQVFRPPHPYNWPTLGALNDLKNASLEDVTQFHAAHYMPNNAVLAIVGPIDENKVLERVRFWFEGLPAGTPPAPLDVQAVDSLGGRRESTLRDEKITIPMLVMAFPVPGRGKPGSNAMSALVSILGSGRSARLIHALTEQTPALATSISIMNYDLAETDVIEIQAMPAKGVRLPQLEAAINAELEKIITDGVSPQELERVKTKMRANFYDGLQTVEGQSLALSQGEADSSNPNTYIDGVKREIEALSSEDLLNAARRLVPENSSIVNVLPTSRLKP